MNMRVLLVLVMLAGCKVTPNDYDLTIDKFMSREVNDFHWEISYALDGYHFAEDSAQQRANAVYDPNETEEIQYPESNQGRIKLHLAKVDEEGEGHLCFADIWLRPNGEGLYPEKTFYIILDENGNRISPEEDAAGVTELRFRLTRGQ